MNHHLLHILQAWRDAPSSLNWLLGIVSQVEGSAYRKTGSMMLLSDTGQQFGMLSGGCLESDLQLQAARAWQTQSPRTIQYDSSDEDNLMWQLGLGCGGCIEITLLPMVNDHLLLNTLLESLETRRACRYVVSLTRGEAEIREAGDLQRAERVGDTLHIPVQPPPHLAVIGAGLDSQPIVDIAIRLGWQVTLIEHRPARYKPHLFHRKARFLYSDTEQLPEALQMSIDACMICTHNIESDAKALLWAQNSTARYCGLLGPPNRKDKVLDAASLSDENLRTPLCGPAGLALGGELPESIALSILAECHATLYGAHGGPLSHRSLV